MMRTTTKTAMITSCGDDNCDSCGLPENWDLFDTDEQQREWAEEKRIVAEFVKRGDPVYGAIPRVYPRRLYCDPEYEA